MQIYNICKIKNRKKKQKLCSLKKKKKKIKKKIKNSFQQKNYKFFKNKKHSTLLNISIIQV